MQPDYRPPTPSHRLLGLTDQEFQAICNDLGLVVAPEKMQGLCTTLTFLGIEIDTVLMQLRLPTEKLQSLLRLLNSWLLPTKNHTARRSGTKRDLLSLVGRLNHAARVVRPGRPFLRSLINAASSVKSLDHRVHLNSASRQDLAWLHAFLRTWNGVRLWGDLQQPLDTMALA